MATNKAAWQPFQNASSLKVGTAPYTPATGDMIVVKIAAVAINPIDWLIQSRGDIMFTYLKYPFILGCDIAGEVVEVGQDVSRFHVGDRVLGIGRGSSKDINDPAQGGFQHYSLIRQNLACAIPSSISYESASVIPLGLATALAGLFGTAQLGLQLPAEPARPATGKTLIVWGGSTSVGCNAIQLAIAAGYEVFSTSSPKNFEYLKSLGASRIFDYHSPTVADDMIRALRGKTTAGALSIGSGAAEYCMKILDRSFGDKFVSMATFPVPEKEPKVLVFPRTAAYFISWLIAYKFKGMMKGIKSNLIDINPVINSGIGKHVFEDFLPSALRAGNFVPAPQPEVVGHGLESVQEGFNRQRKGVSAKKLVITL
jgi:NADPH:quinone reductase-like Zn-dependent oxidoreductase